MADIHAVITLPLYQVSINDGGSDGGTTSRLTVADLPPSMASADLDTAVAAFGAALAAIGSYRLVGITRITAGATVL